MIEPDEPLWNAMKEGLPGGKLRFVTENEPEEARRASGWPGRL
jgi:hypothetical protein